MAQFDVEILTTTVKRVAATDIHHAQERAKKLFDNPVLRSITQVEHATLRTGPEVPTIEIV